MNNRLTKEEAIDQVFSTVELENVVGNPESLSDFLDHVELGVRAFVRVMLQQYAEDEFMRYIGAKPYERTPHRRDYRHGHRKRTVETRIGLIDDLDVPLGRNAVKSLRSLLFKNIFPLSSIPLLMT
jgi:hypothetical protein